MFDLDGTLLDTATDLGLALNLQRQRHGLPDLPQQVIRPYASHGSKGLLSIGFGLDEDSADFDAMRQEYLALYTEVLTHNPVLFPGMQQVLQTLEQQGKRWGVVTNKPRRFTEPLLRAIALYERAACVVCADDAARAKPHPDTLLLAASQTGVAPAQALYIGDAERDIQAGKAAGMATVVALYGYLDASDQPYSWGADHYIESASQVLALA